MSVLFFLSYMALILIQGSFGAVLAAVPILIVLGVYRGFVGREKQYCPFCFQETELESIICNNCYSSLQDSCPNCGESVRLSQTVHTRNREQGKVVWVKVKCPHCENEFTVKAHQSILRI